MEIVVKNIGKVKEANIKIDGITVIAGENDTGKSTISKVLFTVFNTFYNINKKIKMQKESSIKKIIDSSIYNKIDFSNETFFESFFENSNFTRMITNEIIKNFEIYKINNNKLRNKILDYLEEFNLRLEKNSNINDIVEKIKLVLNISNEEAEKSILNENLNNEFNKQINNIFFDKKGIIEINLEYLMTK